VGPASGNAYQRKRDRNFGIRRKRKTDRKGEKRNLSLLENNGWGGEVNFAKRPEGSKIGRGRDTKSLRYFKKKKGRRRGKGILNQNREKKRRSGAKGPRREGGGEKRKD